MRSFAVALRFSYSKKNSYILCLQVHRKYDLKGSTVDREASDKEKAKKDPTLKDMDFLNDGAKIKIGDDARGKLLETLTADVEFLTKNAIMDYSLLLGIHDTKRVRRGMCTESLYLVLTITLHNMT